MEGQLPVVIDASAILAVLLREPRRDSLIALTAGASLLSPASTPWEIGNALVAGWRRKRLAKDQVELAWASFQGIPLRLIEVDVRRALLLAMEHGLYAYDAYLLEAAMSRRLPLLTLDRELSNAARQVGVESLEV